MSSQIDSSHLRRQGRALRNRNQPRQKIPVRPPRPSGGKAKAEGSGLSPEVTAIRESERRSKFALRRKHFLVWFLVLLQAVLIGTVVYLVRAPEPELPSMPDRETREVCFRVKGSEDITETVFYGENVSMPPSVEAEGYTFLGWLDADGRTESHESIPVYRDLVFTAQLVPAFETEKHIPYLTTDAEAVLDVDGPITIREFVNILYLLLDTEATGNGSFVDVPEDDSCYAAAAYLKDLGILSGTRLHPDENLSCGEMIETLCRFFPAEDGTFVFQDLDSDSLYYPCFCTAAAKGWIPSGKLVRTEATEAISRGRFARIMNHVLQRDAVRHLDQEDVGTILDVPPSGDYYDDVVEAVIPHTYRMQRGEEHWISSEALPVHEPGFFFAGVRLHYIDDNGVPAVNGTVNGLDYNRNGEVTTGDAWLDRALWAILEDNVDPKRMDREDMLRILYDYVVNNFTYRYGSMYAFGAEGWAVREARRMLEYGSGNCYCFAALFYELARFVGYDAKLYSGRAYGEQYEYRTYGDDLVYSPVGYTPHGWVEIEFDGVPYIFDTEYEYRSYGLRKMFKADDTVRGQYGYVKADPA